MYTYYCIHFNIYFDTSISICSSIHIDFYVPITYTCILHSLGACKCAPGCKLIIPSMEEVLYVEQPGVWPPSQDARGKCIDVVRDHGQIICAIGSEKSHYFHIYI